jgi:signal transduction histidine kinase
MRHLFRRSIFWLLPVVIVPLIALVVMQYRFLRSLEQKTMMAERNSMRTTLELATSEIETRFRHDARFALSLTEIQLRDVTHLGAHFRAHPVPGAQTFFAMRFKGPVYESGYWDPNAVERLPHDDEIEAVKMATVSWHVAHKLGRIAQPSLSVDERDPRHCIILRPVVDASMHVVGVAGVVLDPARTQKAMTEIGTLAVKRHIPDDPMALRIGEQFPKMSGGGPFITQPLGFVFTNWRAGVRDLCASPEEIAAYNFRNNVLWTGGAFIVLLGAIGLALAAVARQMRLSQMKSDFVSNVSHELRTPLSSIRVFGEYMRLGRVEKPEKVREYGEYIEAESRRLTQLINNILDFSKIESAEKKYRFCATDVVTLVEQTVGAFAMPLREEGVTIAFRAPSARPILQLDKDALAQVLVNLLDNAVKYSGDRREIDVAVDVGRDVRVAIRDRGIGIAPSDQKKIFEKFYRVGSGLVHDVKGSGLGLSIVQHVVRAHGGRVEVASVPGEGSTFTIVLPLAAKQEVPIPTTREFA